MIILPFLIIRSFCCSAVIAHKGWSWKMLIMMQMINIIIWSFWAFRSVCYAADLRFLCVWSSYYDVGVRCPTFHILSSFIFFHLPVPSTRPAPILDLFSSGLIPVWLWRALTYFGAAWSDSEPSSDRLASLVSAIGEHCVRSLLISLHLRIRPSLLAQFMNKSEWSNSSDHYSTRSLTDSSLSLAGRISWRVRFRMLKRFGKLSSCGALSVS